MPLGTDSHFLLNRSLVTSKIFHLMVMLSMLLGLNLLDWRSCFDRLVSAWFLFGMLFL